MTWGRIDAYRNKTGKNLDQVAEALGIGKSMLMMVKSGKRNLSGKALYRLESAEREAGITPPAQPEAETEYFQPLENIPEKIPMPGRVAECRVEYGTVPALEHRLADLETKVEEQTKMLKRILVLMEKGNA